jgi:molybdopterin converting factor small subunit
LFGYFAEKAGWSERNIHADRLQQLTKTISNCNPEIAAALNAGKVRVALNYSLVDGDVALSADDEVALFPPVSGVDNGDRATSILSMLRFC